MKLKELEKRIADMSLELGKLIEEYRKENGIEGQLHADVCAFTKENNEDVFYASTSLVKWNGKSNEDYNRIFGLTRGYNDDWNCVYEYGKIQEQEN